MGDRVFGNSYKTLFTKETRSRIKTQNAHRRKFIASKSYSDFGTHTFFDISMADKYPI